ncbi:MAG: methylated-DNA--[protein]-cysteine S-methyltransferase [Sulfuricaulis sp.]|uniref:methylated-DNA--[protein]-cysteine S-methyltransferase n=1 Tax=Sulfuricaulis sp. TaxID=2003553 RepID=UPI0034A497BC
MVAPSVLSVDNESMRNRKNIGKTKKYDAVIATPVGRVGIVMQDGALVDVSFLGIKAPLRAPRTVSAQLICHQLRSYFNNPHLSFRIPLVLSGTAFQLRVWRALRRIPTGRTLSYGALARKLSTSARAVGNACRANPVPIVIPCHRVVASNGAGGFMGKRSGSALRLKRRLLQHELTR